jgi:hypothetical protein
VTIYVGAAHPCINSAGTLARRQVLVGLLCAVVRVPQQLSLSLPSLTNLIPNRVDLSIVTNVQNVVLVGSININGDDGNDGGQ